METGAMEAIVLVSLGGVLGANARYLVSTWAAGRFGTAFPYGTLVVNVAGSLLLGLVLGLVAARFGNSTEGRLLVATGFLGAETTFSTFAYETIALVRLNDYAGALRNVLGTTLLGVAGAAIGLGLAALLTGAAW